VRPRSTHRRRAVATIALVAAVGCGGGERQDADEPEGDFAVEVVSASFPERLRLGQSADLEITVRNAGDEAVPNLAVTVRGFNAQREETDLADASRPRFAVNGIQEQIGGLPEAREAAPGGCTTAYVNTWACGPLQPDDERTLEWSVTAVRAGPFEIAYSVAGGLTGKARAVAADGGEAPQGTLTGDVSDKPAQTRVGDDGKTVVTEPR
jgi:hypothetical protein